MPAFLLSLPRALSAAGAGGGARNSQPRCRTSPGCSRAVPNQHGRADFGRGAREDKLVVTEVVILAPFYFMWYVFLSPLPPCTVRHSLPLVYLPRCVWYRIMLVVMHQEMVEGSDFRLFFFATARVGSLPESQVAWQEITKRLASKSDFSLVNFACVLKDKMRLEQPRPRWC